MKILTTCPHTIPAERCAVVICPSMMARHALLNEAGGGGFTALNELEAHGVDEIECAWSGELEVEEHETRYEWYAEGDCPRCGQPLLIKATD